MPGARLPPYVSARAPHDVTAPADRAVSEWARDPPLTASQMKCELMALAGLHSDTASDGSYSGARSGRQEAAVHNKGRTVMRVQPRNPQGAHCLRL
ncbi:hypothetical protein NDU88_006242 [Pleurodeles waltl]|uniref:Uncharacterized protein n=1 Tax=Pleurodeles waltl TaxID=8319 RepID=A0AAV7WDE1_PLEWA|nr:hypothetical protein NDU88_006242 [Pleurodeles waltl]